MTKKARISQRKDRDLPCVLSLREIKDLSSRFATASGSVKVPPTLRHDLAVASLLIQALVRTGAIAGPVDLAAGHGDD